MADAPKARELESPEERRARSLLEFMTPRPYAADIERIAGALAEARSAAVAEVVGPLREWLEARVVETDSVRSRRSLDDHVTLTALRMYRQALDDVRTKLDELTKGGK